MRPNKAAWRAAAITLALALAGSPAVAAPTQADALATLRQACIAAARELQQREGAVVVLEHEIDLLGREADGRQRGLDESRTEQARLLGLLEQVARNPPDRLAFALEQPLDRVRGELLVQGLIPALRAEGRALIGEIERVAELRRTVAAKQAELPAVQAAPGAERERLAQLVADRLQLIRKMLPEDGDSEMRAAKLGHEAGNLADLIKRGGAMLERRDKDLLARAVAAAPKAKASAVTPETADPTRPADFHRFQPPDSALLSPVAGVVLRRFGEAGTPAAESEGLWFAGLPGGEVVAPFDGRVVYAGPFANLGLVLIIQHGDEYHAVLAALGRVDVTLGQWVLVGEPVGAMPDPAGRLYFELRRDGRPVDPQPWLATREAGRDKTDGEPKGE